METRIPATLILRSQVNGSVKPVVEFKLSGRTMRLYPEAAHITNYCVLMQELAMTFGRTHPDHKQE